MSTPARACGVWILHHKSRAAKIFGEVNGGAMKIGETDRIEKNFHIAAFDDGVVFAFVVKSKTIFETGTTAALHIDAKSFAFRFLFPTAKDFTF